MIWKTEWQTMKPIGCIETLRPFWARSGHLIGFEGTNLRPQSTTRDFPGLRAIRTMVRFQRVGS